MWSRVQRKDAAPRDTRAACASVPWLFCHKCNNSRAFFSPILWLESKADKTRRQGRDTCSHPDQATCNVYVYAEAHHVYAKGITLHYDCFLCFLEWQQGSLSAPKVLESNANGSSSRQRLKVADDGSSSFFLIYIMIIFLKKRTSYHNNDNDDDDE